MGAGARAGGAPRGRELRRQGPDAPGFFASERSVSTGGGGAGKSAAGSWGRSDAPGTPRGHNEQQPRAPELLGWATRHQACARDPAKHQLRAGRSGATCSPPLTPSRPEGSCLRAHPGAPERWVGAPLSPPFSAPTSPTLHSSTCLGSWLPRPPSSILIPGRSQVGPSNLAAEKRQRCLPVAKTRLYRGASLRLSPSESERARGAFPSVLWQTKAGDKGERTPGRLCRRFSF